LKVRGGGEVSATWKNGILTKIIIKSTVPHRFCLKIPEKWDKNRLKQMKLCNFERSNDTIYFYLKANQKAVFTIQ
jgi:hypothetical protein